MRAQVRRVAARRPVRRAVTVDREPRPVPAPSRQALTDAVPLILGYLPFGLLLGATIATSPISDLAGLASSALLFAGASQLVIIDLLGAGVPAVVVVAAALVVNLRHVMYSGAVAPFWRHSPLGWRLAAPHFLNDPVYTLTMVRFPAYPRLRDRHRYYALLAATLMSAWLGMTAAGILLGAQMPQTVGLELAVPLVFVALLVPTVGDRPSLVAALVGGGVTIAAAGLPMRLALLAGPVAGVAAALLADRRR